jgi:hypothetical protein
MTTTVTIYFGGTATDVTSYLRSASIRRGRSRELDTFTAGGATIVLNNYDRAFDPTNRTSPYHGQLKPRVRVNVTDDEVSLFDGYVEDWTLSYDVSGRAEAVVTCVDGLALISQTALAGFVNAEQTPGLRIETVLAADGVDFPGDSDIDGGYAVLQADEVSDGTNTLQYLQTVAATDLGRLFVDGTGTLRYRERTDGLTASPLVVFGSDTDPLVEGLALLSEATLWLDASDVQPLRTDAAALGQVILQDATLWLDASDPDYIPPVINFNEVGLELGSEFLYNRAVITRNNGTAVTASDAASIDDYGIRAYSASGLLFTADAASQAFADYLVTLYGQPTVRVASHRLVLDGLSEVHQRYVKRLEIGDLVRTVWTPLDTGTGLDISSFVEGVEHSITPERHDLTLQLTPLVFSGGFILDDTDEGILDTGELTY